MNVLLVSTYELGRQPFWLASPAAWLRGAGHRVACADLSRERLDPSAIRRAELVAFSLPMHTATPLALPVIDMVRQHRDGPTLSRSSLRQDRPRSAVPYVDEPWYCCAEPLPAGGRLV